VRGLREPIPPYSSPGIRTAVQGRIRQSIIGGLRLEALPRRSSATWVYNSNPKQSFLSASIRIPGAPETRSFVDCCRRPSQPRPGRWRVRVPRMPASTMLGSPKFGWLKTLKNWASSRSFTCIQARETGCNEVLRGHGESDRRFLDLPLVVNYELPGRVEPMSLLLFNRAFYPNLVRATIAGNGVTMAGSFLSRFSPKAWLLFPFGDRGLGALGDVVFNTCWVFALICVGTMLRQSYLTRRRPQVLR
jgi:hypothetical protein